MDSPDGHSVLGSRRGLKLRPIQTNASSPTDRPKRPPRPDYEPARETAADRAPPRSQSSKSSLKSLFSRNKTSRRSNHEQTLPAIAESQKMTTVNIIPDTISSPNSPSTTPMTPKSFVATSSPLIEKTLSSNPSKASKSSKEKGQKLHRTITLWDPPPLFQAYPQAIKQGTLPAPSLSGGSRLRMKGHRRNISARDEFSDVDADDERVSSMGAKKRKEEKDKHHPRKVSGSTNKAEWTQKIFILVTSGYLLQYAGEGSFDRLPEKMMELGKNSVAFASDAIPGRHWVLQISHTLEEDGTVAVDTKKTFFSRFGFSDSRRQTKTLLLVCNDPTEMTSWLSAVRREIEALGGKEYAPETPLDETPQNSQQPQARFIRQSVVPDKATSIPMKVEDQGSPEPSPNTSTNTNEEQKPVGNRSADEASLKSANRRSIRPPSVEAPSLSTNGTVTDLDRLREGSRLSYVSIGTRTIPSSRGSSPGLSPARQSGVTSMAPYGESPASARSTVADASSTRLSIHAYSSMQSEGSGMDTPSGSRPQSTVGPLISRSTSPPNFSVPVFSKRFSATHSGPPPNSRKFFQASPPPSPRIIIPNSHNRLPGLDEFVTPELSNGQAELKKAPTETGRAQQPVPFIFDPETPSRTAVLPKPREKRSRRYSSFESTRGTHSLSSDYRPQLSPVTNESSEEGGYKSDNLSHRNPSQQTHKQVEYIPLSTNAGARQLRRPMSMQIGSEARRRVEATHSPPTTSTSTHVDLISPDGRTSYRRNRASVAHSEIVPDNSPPDDHLPECDRISLHKSASHLSLGPPVAPPPDFPLPRVPPRIASQFRPVWNDQQPTLGPGREPSGPRTRTGQDERRNTHASIAPIDLRDVENSPRLSGMTAKEYSMVNAF
ncbi:hypothetical protein AJ78_02008 [Emergomyces pasteurianus Ep9510]|uniref:PH domain-containing protein n=1 Tax=Emergomyces pasteurianus Ep9510 TaxID=1447872 RepID=A0A1J9QNY9_9EURO|nr:hypothetical protein AJ78_02008 [Emergomyces pasteurianus Ep9510]